MWQSILTQWCTPLATFHYVSFAKWCYWDPPRRIQVPITFEALAWTVLSRIWVSETCLLLINTVNLTSPQRWECISDFMMQIRCSKLSLNFSKFLSVSPDILSLWSKWGFLSTQKDLPNQEPHRQDPSLFKHSKTNLSQCINDSLIQNE